MIEEKLEQARQRSSRRRGQLAMVVVAVVVFSGLVLYALSLVLFSSDQYVQTVPAPGDTLSEQDRGKTREELKQLLQQYENGLEPRLQAVNAELWNREATSAIKELRQKVMSGFSSGDYRNALADLHVLSSRTEQLLEEAQQLYTENLAQASLFLAQDLYYEAKLHIETALLVAPQSPAALQMQQQIEKLPGIFPLLDGAKAARAENDLGREAEYLRQLLHIAPEREEAAGRLQEVTAQLRQNEFAAHIASGFEGVENRQVEAAGYHFRQAAKMYPDRPELAVLASRLSSLEKSLRVHQALEAAEQAVRRDDWQLARVHYARVLSDAPDNMSATDGLSRADKVLRLQTQLRQYLKDPYRLRQQEVYAEAEKTLAEAADAASYSFAIKKEAERLGEVMKKVNRLISVTVISDGQTSVLVRGVGRVGIILEKVIRMKPGSYIFEGVRRGYKSKLVRAFVPYDRNTFSVQVICDEPI